MIAAVTVNYTAVLVAAIVTYIVGAIWHGPLFGKLWMNLMNIKPSKKMTGSVKKSMALGFVSTVLVSFVLAWFLGYSNITTVADSFQFAFWIWLGFSAPIVFGSYIWEGKSLKLVALNAAYRLVELAVLAAVLVSMA